MVDISRIGGVTGSDELAGPSRTKAQGDRFVEALREAIQTTDGMQQRSEAAQAEFAAGKPVDLHDVLIKVEEADIAFRMLMEVRNKLVDAYREIMRMGG